MTIGAATRTYFLHVVGGEVCGWVGGAALPAWAPVADDGAVVGHHPAPTLAFVGVVVEVGAAYPLELVTLALVVGAVGLASDHVAAASGEAGPEQAPAHRRLRRRRTASSRLQLSHRSPQTMDRLQPIQRFLLYALGPYSRPCFPLLAMAPEEGEQDRGRACRIPSNADYPGPFVGRYPDHGHVVEGGPGPGDALAVGAPAAPARQLGEPDGEAEGYPVAGQSEDLVADHGV
jgi:hypothetical protein